MTKRKEVKVIYNELFDKEHYPIKKWQLEELELIRDHFDMPDYGTWVYFATIHGVIFSYRTNTCNIAEYRGSGLSHSDIKFLSERTQLRGIDRTEDETTISLTHHEDEVIKNA